MARSMEGVRFPASQYFFYFSFTFARKAALRCAVE